MTGQKPKPNTLRIAAYNVEWFDSLFDEFGHVLHDNGPSARHGVTKAEQLDALAAVFQAIDADAVMVIEAPAKADKAKDDQRLAALSSFAVFAGLRSHSVVVGFESDTRQQIALMYDPAVMDARHDPRGASLHEVDPLDSAPRFDGYYSVDLDGEGTADRLRFSKPPLEIDLSWAGGSLRLIGVHIKSKAPHGAKSARDAMRISIENRRKQLAQSLWLRDRVSAHLKAAQDVIVLGDFNDGPGLDEYEALFGRSSVEIVMGLPPAVCQPGQSARDLAPSGAQLYDPNAHAGLCAQGMLGPSSARFFLQDQSDGAVQGQGRYGSALLDYVMVSPALKPRATWRIWHPLEDALLFENDVLRRALLDASDHFPVVMDLKPGP